jgi:hypothetical protein
MAMPPGSLWISGTQNQPFEFCSEARKAVHRRAFDYPRFPQKTPAIPGVSVGRGAIGLEIPDI